MLQPHVLQQALVVTGMLLCGFCDGFIFGQMSGMLSALKEDETVRLSDANLSWIASIINVSCFIGIGIGGYVALKFGRRKAITILTTPILISWLMVYFAHSVVLLMLSRVIVGLCFGGVFIVTIIAVGEYTAPNIRGLCLMTITNVSPAVGTTFGHVLGILLNWRTVALIGLIPTTFTVILPFFWKESPSWLAVKGRFEECATSFRSLRGTSAAAERELTLLIELEKSKGQKSSNPTAVGSRMASAKYHIMVLIKKKYYWKIMALGCVVGVYRAASGKILFNTFAVTILKDVTRSDDVLLFTLLVDVFIVVGAVMSCILVNKMKVRTLLFPAGAAANILLIALSACLYSQPDDNTYFPWINTFLLASYFVLSSSGPYPLLENLYSEIVPLDIKSSVLSIFGIINGIFIFLTIKLASVMTIVIGYHGIFFLNGMIMSACLIYMWIWLPETKGRTLQEIELYFKYNTFENIDDLVRREQLKSFVV